MAGLLRSTDWLASQGVERIGDWVELDLEEMGATGAFQVMAINPCPTIESGSGRVVTGWFRHRRATVGELWIEGELHAIGTTAQHPFWSADRRDWISAGELLPGERVSIKGGFAAVVGFNERGEEPVFNLEVDADHCYRVGEQGILVHNASDKCPVSEADCETIGKTRRTSITNPKTGKTFKFTFDKCRTLTAEGPIACIDELKQDRKPGAQTDMLDLFFGTGTKASPLRLPPPSKYNAGHMIGNELGGPGDIENLVPMQATFNKNKAWRQMEMWIRECLCSTCRPLNGNMKVTAHYPVGVTAVPDRNIPASFTVELGFSRVTGGYAGSIMFSLMNSETQGV